MGKPITQYCGRCKARQPIKGFDIELGVCASCKAAVSTRVSRPQAVKQPAPNPPNSRKKWRCPKCLQQVPVDAARGALEVHLNKRRETCGGSGYELPAKSQDALDYRVHGSFESGKR